MYTSFSLNANTFPHLIGFENLFDRIDKINNLNKNHSNYPPYNISKLDEQTYLIEMAVAGFNVDDIDIELQNAILTKDGVDKKYIHKGISDRAFRRQFTLAENVQVGKVKLVNGMLNIYLEHIIPDELKPKKIKIDNDAPSKKELLTEKVFGKRAS
jgi:molecular chaperone IbpA